ncbi:ribosomal protein L1 [Thelephora terrestris]|uniref:Ribosomal protein L1 n=1 Tax=Thelephora terrestris TaxID=56493 RepID=A0A9P6HH92_9AGAM|nr:ribosomal protein L1 [Thelephora terrestris]
MSLGLLGRQCCRSALQPNSLLLRQFNTTSVLFARREKKIPTPTKKQLAAKARKKALKVRKHIYDAEKMPLQDAIAVLRAVEVARPNATLELTVKTAMPKGTTIPKGRLTWPREAKPRTEERVLVFAEGRLAEEAKRAGAHIVGGLELVDDIINGRHNPTTILCVPSLLRSITPKLGRLLGPKGLMPSERRGTVTEDIAGYIRRMQGSVEWKGDKDGTIRAAVAKITWPLEDITKNFRYFSGVVKKATGNARDPEAEAKGQGRQVNPLTRIVLSSSQGPAIQIADF